jgi:enterochelin esterase-like enzyme
MFNVVLPLAISAALAMPTVSFDSIAWAKLNPWDKDCDSVTDAPVCRLKRPFSARDISDKLNAGVEVWRSGNELTFAARNQAEQMLLSGGVQLPMSNIVGTDLWVVTIKVPRLDEAFITYFFVPVSRDRVGRMKFEARVWRGPKAIALPDTVATVTGRITKDVIDSKFLKARRDVVIYEPVARGNEPVAGVIYVGDGGSVHGLAKVVEKAILNGSIPRILLVGVIADTTREPVDGRAAEYIHGYTDGAAMWDAHESFIMNEVLPFAQQKYNAPTDRGRVGIAGYSNSAAWSITMGLRHPDVFGNVISLSPAGRNAELADTTNATAWPAFYVTGGTLEAAFHAKAVAWAGLFAKAGVRHALREPVAGHDMMVWNALFLDGVRWLFNGK